MAEAPSISKRKSRVKAGILAVSTLALVVPGLLGASAVSAQAAATNTSAASDTTNQTNTAAQDPTTPATNTTAVKPKKKKLTKHQKIVATAKKNIGSPYRFGGASPKGFDCSGLTMYVYSHVGLHLPHSAYRQDHLGHYVSIKNAEPGDLIDFNGGEHVGIWLSKTRMIDAPSPGKHVGVHTIWKGASYKIIRIG
jgi:peptidoglycan DL-endopeptidase CwlO